MIPATKWGNAIIPEIKETFGFFVRSSLLSVWLLARIRSPLINAPLVTPPITKNTIAIANEMVPYSSVFLVKIPRSNKIKATLNPIIKDFFIVHSIPSQNHPHSLYEVASITFHIYLLSCASKYSFLSRPPL